MNTDEVRLDRLTWPDVELRLGAGWDTVLLPMGATEQHGPHLPLGTDTLIAAELAARAARRLGSAFAAPPLPVGASAEHREFPGTLSLAHETLAAVVSDLCAWLRERGVARVVVFSAHGGNREALELAAAQAGPGVIVLGELPPAGPPLDESEDAHAGRSETSMLLAIEADAVHLDRAEAGHTGALDPAVWARLRTAGVRAVATNGVLGDPAGASPELGEVLLDAQAAAIVDAVERAARS